MRSGFAAAGTLAVRGVEVSAIVNYVKANVADNLQSSPLDHRWCMSDEYMAGRGCETGIVCLKSGEKCAVEQVSAFPSGSLRTMRRSALGQR
jgi:hypothetical protein